VDALQSRIQFLESILEHLKDGQEAQVSLILERIKCSDIRKTNAQVFADILSDDNLRLKPEVDMDLKDDEPPSSSTPSVVDRHDQSQSTLSSNSLSDDLSRVISRLDVNDVGEVHYFGPSSNLNLVSDVRRVRVPPPPPRNAGDRSSSFSSAAGTSDVDPELLFESALTNESASPPLSIDDTSTAIALEDHLLSLYWTWQHPFFLLFSRPLFLRDLQASRVAAAAPGANDGQKGRWSYRGPRLNHFSPLLLNAILAHAAHLSDRPDVRADPSDPRTAGDPYFARARRLLEAECENPSMTTVQALALMGSREAGCGRDTGLGWLYSGAWHALSTL
jgi:hypothetical protein